MCVFCKIIKGEIPSFKIYENEFVMAFLDINASTSGHTLIVPKVHFENIFDLSVDASLEMIKATKVVSDILLTRLGIKGINLINNSGEIAGQTVMHFHLHVIPRYNHDEIKISPKTSEPDFAKLQTIHLLLTKK